MTDLKASASSGIRWNLVSRLISAGSQFARMAVLARLLLPKDYGIMAMAMTFVGLAQSYADSGMSAAIVFQQKNTSKSLSSLYWLNIAVGLALFLASVISAPLLSMFFQEKSLITVLPALGSVLFINSFGCQFNTLHQKELHFSLLAKQDVVCSILGTIGAVLLGLLGVGVWALVGATILESIAKTCALFISGYSRWRPKWHFTFDDIRGYVGFGTYQLGERTVNYINSKLDVILLGRLLGATSLGYYNFAFQLSSQIVDKINPAFTTVAFPIFSRMQNETGLLQKWYLKMVRLLTIINAPVLLGTAGAAACIIQVVFDPKWLPAVHIMLPVSVILLLRSTFNPVGSLLLAKGRPDIGFKWNLVLLCIFPIVVYTGARLGNMYGLVWGLLILQLLLIIPSYYFLIAKLIGRCGYKYLLSFGQPILNGVLMAIAVLLSGRVFHNPKISLLVQIGTGGIVYFFLLFCFNRADINVALEAIAMSKKR